MGTTMSQKIRQPETSPDEVRFPQGVVFRPPVTIEDLRTDIEHDPEGADEFVALIRLLRQEGSPELSL
jgi:hypothetical protein